MKEILVNHIDKYGLLGQHQYGFRKKRSCLAQLLQFYENVLQDIENGSNNYVLVLDFAKAFDKVDFYLLCHRLKERSIWGKMGIWLQNFLHNRKQWVVANGILSSSTIIRSGVPQGTVLGPFFFLVYILTSLTF